MSSSNPSESALRSGSSAMSLTSLAAPPSLSRPRPQRRRSSSLSLEFRDGVRHLDVYHDPAVTFMPSSLNGTFRDELPQHFKSPHKALGSLVKTVRQRWSSWDLGRAAETASDTITAGLNRAFEGKDAVEMANSIVCNVPSIRFPSLRQLDQAIDNITDKLQGLTVSNQEPPPPPSGDPQGAKWMFAEDMGKRAIAALVRHKVCKLEDIMDAHRESSWPVKLGEALANTYKICQPEYSLSQLQGMKPTWIAVRDEKIWRLVLDTGRENLITEKDEDVIIAPDSDPVYIETGFSVPETNEWGSKIEDRCRETYSVEGGEWELVEA